jgi:hypothetical protein
MQLGSRQQACLGGHRTQHGCHAEPAGACWLLGWWALAANRCVLSASAHVQGLCVQGDSMPQLRPHAKASIMILFTCSLSAHLQCLELIPTEHLSQAA